MFLFQSTRYKLHVICDEVYALTLVDDDVTFRSVSTLDRLPDPDRTHMVWGVSKVCVGMCRFSRPSLAYMCTKVAKIPIHFISSNVMSKVSDANKRNTRNCIQGIVLNRY